VTLGYRVTTIVLAARCRVSATLSHRSADARDVGTG